MVYIARLCEFIHTTDNAEWELSRAETVRAYHGGMVCLQCYGELAKLAAQANVCLYRLRPKNHAFQEQLIFMKTTRINPHIHSTWMSEDFMHRSRLLVSHSQIRRPIIPLIKWILYIKERIHDPTKRRADRLEKFRAHVIAFLNQEIRRS